MIDISKISSESMQRLAAAYLHATFILGISPLEASKKKQHKIRKHLSKQYAKLKHEFTDEISEDIISVFSAENSDREVLSLLKECHDFEEALAKKKEEQFEADFDVVDESIKSAFKALLQLEFWPKIDPAGSDIKFVVDDTPAYRKTLTLKNTAAVPQDKEGYYCKNLEMMLKKEENRFCFCGELEDPAEETTTTFSIPFENAETEVEIYNACNNVTFWENPWDFLRTISFAIGMKAELPGDCCNAKEKALLPLIKEIVMLEYWMRLPEQTLSSFSELKKLVRQYGSSKAEMLLSKLEKIKPGDNAFYNIVKKLKSLLCQKQYEPLWREIYNKILDSQAEYPNKTDSLCDKEMLTGVRGDIQALMESKGYTGTYPDFVKKGALDGIHLEHSYHTTYFVAMEKRARYHIHCYEVLKENDWLTIQFLCGTAFLKKDEEETDIYDCLFNAKGRRLFHTVHHYIPFQTEDEMMADDLETSVTIAVKKAECIKLTKAEQKEFYGKIIPGWGMFWMIFLIVGGIFGIAMTAIMMLLCIIATVAFGFASSIPEILKEMPWGLFLAISWIGFGGAMGIVEVLALRK